MTDLHSTAEEPLRVVLVLAMKPDERELAAEREDEMRALLDTAGCEVVGVIHQFLARPVGSTYIGKGKLEEVRQLCEVGKADEVTFDVELTPSQERNIERALERRVVDYTALILHIFALNARTHQAKLAVELAQLQHNRSRLKRLWSHLDRIKAGMNMRGPGEKQLEVDRRLVDMRIQDLSGKLREIEHRKERTIASRDDVFKVCLVGYTNAGKSTLMNTLTDAGVLAQDRLFATLDTRTSRLPLDPKRAMVISDTVGFIRHLPHGLVASFHATLAEVREANLLLHVVDASMPSMEEQITAVEEVLEEIKATEIPSILVFNKIDKPHSKTIVLAFQRRYRGSVGVSAFTGEGIDELKAAILREAEAQRLRLHLRIEIADGATAAFLRGNTDIVEESYNESHAVFTVETDERIEGQIRENPRIEILPDPDAAGTFSF